MVREQTLPFVRRQWHNRSVGSVFVDVEVGRDRGPREKARFLVDSGAAYSVLPHEVWRRLGLRTKRVLDFSLADGTMVRRRLSECRFRYRGLDAASPVVMGEPGDAALLGTVTLETLGLVLNPFDRTLSPMRMTLACVPQRAGYPL
jgi:predicted aspartyl protease